MVNKILKEMKKYIKTKWQDNKTPVNAENLNKIEDAIYDLSANAIGYSSFKEGDGIDLTTDEKGKITVSTDKTVLRSGTGITGMEVLLASNQAGCCCVQGKMEKGKVYFILDEDTKTLKFIVLNGVKIFDPASLIPPVMEEEKKDPYEPTPDHEVEIEDGEDDDENPGEVIVPFPKPFPEIGEGEDDI